MTPEECREVFALLSQYIDGELPPDICRRLEGHIGDCAPCVEFMESLKKVSRIAKQGGPAEMPEPIPEQVRQEILEKYRRFKNSLPAM